MIPALKSQGNELLAVIHEEFPGYHPILAIARIAHATNAEGVLSASPELQFQCHKTIAPYITPALKSVEMRTTSEDLPIVRVSLFEMDEVEDAEIIMPPLMDATSGDAGQ